MTSVLVAVVVLAVGLGALNLVITLAVLRRLREHSALLSDRQPEHGILTAGQAPTAFAATDLDGRPVRQGEFSGAVLVAFLSTDCSACTQALPGFAARVTDFPGGRENVLAVVSGDPGDAPDMVPALTGVARVVVEEQDGALATAFGVRAFPAWCLLDDAGTVRDSDSGLDSVRVPAVA